MELEEAAPHDRDVGGIPAIVECYAGNAGEGSRQSPDRARTRMRVDAETVRDIALAASGLLNPRSADRASIRPRRRACSSHRRVMRRNRGRCPRERTGIAAGCTRSASAACRIRCCRRSTRRTVRCPACGGPVEHTAAGADHVERAAVCGIGTGAGETRFEGRRRDRCGADDLCVPAVHVAASGLGRSGRAVEFAGEGRAPDRGRVGQRAGLGGSARLREYGRHPDAHRGVDRGRARDPQLDETITKE